MKPEVVEIFRTIEVAEYFMRAYNKAVLATLEEKGEKERIEIRNTNYERIETMFFALKMTKFMQLPKRWKGEYSGFDRLRELLDEDKFPDLLADVAIAQEEAQELVKQFDAVVYSRGNGMGLCNIKDSEIAFAVKTGAEAFIDDTSFIIREMKDKEARKGIVEELKMYL